MTINEILDKAVDPWARDALGRIAAPCIGDMELGSVVCGTARGKSTACVFLEMGSRRAVYLRDNGREWVLFIDMTDDSLTSKRFDPGSVHEVAEWLEGGAP